MRSLRGRLTTFMMLFFTISAIVLALLQPALVAKAMTVDPSFGYDVIGSLWNSEGRNFVVGEPFRSPSNCGTALSITAALGATQNGTCPCSGAIYSSNLSTLIVGASFVSTFLTTNDTWYTFTFASTSLSPNTVYYFVIYVGAGALPQFGRVDRDLGGSGSWNYYTLSSWPSSLSLSTDYYEYSIFVNYTATGKDTLPPTYSLPNPSYSSTAAGQTCVLSCRWTDDVAVSMVFESNNASGSWSYNNSVALTSGWANFTVTLPSRTGAVVSYYWIANDTSNNWNTSMPIQTLTTTTIPEFSNILILSLAFIALIVAFIAFKRRKPENFKP